MLVRWSKSRLNTAEEPAQSRVHGLDDKPPHRQADQQPREEVDGGHGPVEPTRHFVLGKLRRQRGRVEREDAVEPVRHLADFLAAGQLGQLQQLEEWELRPQPNRQHAAQDAEKPPGQGLAVVAGAALLGLEDDDGPRRRHRQGIDGRDDRRYRDGHGKLAEELAGDAAQEANRDEHRAQHQGDRQDGAGDFLHRLDGGRARVQAGGDQPLDVLQHHDGVVHDDADGQHQAEQRQVVQRETQAAP